MDPTCLYKAWLRQQRRLRDDLLSARPARSNLGQLIKQAVGLYEAYYQSRAHSIVSDPITLLACPGATKLERAGYWIAGWRPTTMIHLLYSESGARFEAQLSDLLLGVHSGDLGDLSPEQLKEVDELQRRTIAEEDDVAAEMAEVQEGVGAKVAPTDGDLEEMAGRVGMVVAKADGVRIRALRGLMGILGDVQAVDLLVAIADLEIRIRGIGVEFERTMVEGCF